MKLDIFNPWREVAKYGELVIQGQTTKKGNAFVTYLRDAKTKAPITSGVGMSKESSQENAVKNLNAIGGDGVQQAIRTGQPIHPSRVEAPKKDIDWRDGAHHRYRAQRDIVDKPE